MALATKCPQCGALFRVVADQLKLRGGLVRCGQCRTVFDAIGSLTYVDEGTLTNGAPATAGTAGTAPNTEAAPTRNRPARNTRSAKALGPTTTLRISPGAAPVATISSLPPSDLPPPPAPAPRKGRKESLEEAALTDAGVPTLLAPDISRGRTETELPPAGGIEVIEMPAVGEAMADPTPEPVAVDEPAFARSARRAPRRGFSIVFTIGSLLLALVAAAQLAVIFRSDVLARVPALRPMLVQACEVFGCTLGWPTQPDQLAVIGSELQSLPGTDVLELTAVVRNRASFTQALPALEVTLTDTRNQPIARKVFTPADYLAAAGEPRARIDQGLAAGADFTIRVFFEARGVQAAGFLVYPFFI